MGPPRYILFTIQVLFKLGMYACVYSIYKIIKKNVWNT